MAPRFFVEGGMFKEVVLNLKTVSGSPNVIHKLPANADMKTGAALCGRKPREGNDASKWVVSVEPLFVIRCVRCARRAHLKTIGQSSPKEEWKA